MGPLVPQSAQVEFEEEEPPEPIREGVDALKAQGVECVVGRWLVRGRPWTVLIDLRSLRSQIPVLRQQFIDDHGLYAERTDALVGDVLAFGHGVRCLLNGLSSSSEQPALVAHFHEWMAATALPCLSADEWTGRSIFTTHATLLGRYLAGDENQPDDAMHRVDPMVQASKYGIAFQHGIECLAAKAATVFSTVSSITGRECEALLGRRPDSLLPNGINIQRFEVIHEFQGLHQQNKQRLHEFTRGYFFPSYEFDLDQTLYMVNSGRFEYRNKGMDLTLDALARLNERLKSTCSTRTVVFFLITRRPVKSLSVGSPIPNHVSRVAEYCEEVGAEVEKGLTGELAAGRTPI